jgi:hypothetical protein
MPDQLAGTNAAFEQSAIGAAIGIDIRSRGGGNGWSDGDANG